MEMGIDQAKTGDDRPDHPSSGLSSLATLVFFFFLLCCLLSSSVASFIGEFSITDSKEAATVLATAARTTLEPVSSACTRRDLILSNSAADVMTAETLNSSSSS